MTQRPVFAYPNLAACPILFPERRLRPGSLSFGLVAQTGLSEEFVANDLTVVGSLAGGGDLGAVDLIYVPEPSTLVLLTLGLLGLVACGRRRVPSV